MVGETNNEYLITIPEACEYLHCGRSTMYSLLKEGKLKCFKINRRWKIPRNSIQDYIFEQAEARCTK